MSTDDKDYRLDLEQIVKRKNIIYIKSIQQNIIKNTNKQIKDQITIEFIEIKKQKII